MKKLLSLLLVLSLLPVCALASTTFDGKVVASETTLITAPFGGTVQRLPLRAGSLVTLGDTVAELQTTKVYAPVDGVVAGVFGQAGDSVETVSGRYGAVMVILPERRYTVSADIQKAYNSSENKYIHIGETVYMTCVSDGAHTAQGVVTTASGSSYTVETTSGELMLGENVYIYRSEDRDTHSRIGRGSVGRTAETKVTGSGSILRLHVKDGDAVKRGDLLFETVSGQLDGLYAVGSEVQSPVSGVVATVNTSVGANVNKGDTLLTVYSMEKLQAEFSVNEYDLQELQEGDAVKLTFSQDDQSPIVLTGTVSMISYLSSDQGSEASYQAWVDFEAVEGVRIGMTVVVETLDGGEAAE